MSAKRGTYVDLDCFLLDDGRVMVCLDKPGHRIPEEFVPAASICDGCCREALDSGSSHDAHTGEPDVPS